MTEPEAVTAALDYNDAKADDTPAFEELTLATRGGRSKRLYVILKADWSPVMSKEMPDSFKTRQRTLSPESRVMLKQDYPALRKAVPHLFKSLSPNPNPPPLEARVAKLRESLGPKQQNPIKHLVKRYTDGDITLERLVGEIENYQAQVEDKVKFSEGTALRNASLKRD